jgi:hypothetical protein
MSFDIDMTAITFWRCEQCGATQEMRESKRLKKQKGSRVTIFITPPWGWVTADGSLEAEVLCGDCVKEQYIT